MAITAEMTETFEALKEAAANGAISLVETTEIATGRTVALIVVVIGDNCYPVGEFFPEQDPLDRFATPDEHVVLAPNGETIQ